MVSVLVETNYNDASRYRWALIRDEKVAKRAYEYVTESILGASRDTQLRMLRIIKVILANLHTEEDIFAFGHDVMRTRWRRLNAIVSRSRRISLQKIHPHYCMYFKRVREPSPGRHASKLLDLMLLLNLCMHLMGSLRMGEVREGGR